jgi:hypothetical protein
MFGSFTAFTHSSASVLVLMILLSCLRNGSIAMVMLRDLASGAMRFPKSTNC